MYNLYGFGSFWLAPVAFDIAWVFSLESIKWSASTHGLFPWKRLRKRNFKMLRHALKIRVSVLQNQENPSLTWLCSLLHNSAASQKRKLLNCSSIFTIDLSFPFSLWNIPFYSKTSSPAKSRYQGPLISSWSASKPCFPPVMSFLYFLSLLILTYTQCHWYAPDAAADGS